MTFIEGALATLHVPLCWERCPRTFPDFTAFARHVRDEHFQEVEFWAVEPPPYTRLCPACNRLHPARDVARLPQGIWVTLPFICPTEGDAR
jgi:hypothetical protein